MKTMRGTALLLIAAIVCPLAPGGSGDGLASLLDRLPAILDEKIAVLDNLVLRERISRYSQVGGAVRKLDSFDALVNVVDGLEQYSNVRGRNRGFSHVSEIGGTWCFGETVTLLRTTRDAFASRLAGPGTVASGKAGPEMVFTWRYPSASQRWFVVVDSRTLWLDFEGQLRVSPLNGDIHGISWTSARLPPDTGLSEIVWSVDFQSVEIAGRMCTIPETAVYKVVHTGEGSRVEWNETKFSGQGRFGSSVNVRFDR